MSKSFHSIHIYLFYLGGWKIFINFGNLENFQFMPFMMYLIRTIKHKIIYVTL